MDLKELRKEIDSLDDTISSAFLRRMEICADVAEFKKQNGVPVYHPAREREIIARITDGLSPESATCMKILYNTLFEVSRSYQTRRIGNGGALSEKIKTAMETTPSALPQKSTVACQGAEGAYSQAAAEKLFVMPNILHFDSFETVFKAVASGLCKYGVLPIDNNLHGSVNEVYDLMKKHKVYIVKGIRLRIDHSLIAKKGVKLSDIREIISHPQAIGQCKEFLSSLSDVKITECENTAVAAKTVSESGRDDIAAISNPSCASLYGLCELSSSISSSDNNHTRFICISRDLEIFPGAFKNSIMFTLPHTPGSLFSLLSKFAMTGVNFSKIESRPIKGKDFEYMFYLDFEGNPTSKELLEVLDLFDAEYDGGTYLGSYTEV